MSFFIFISLFLFINGIVNNTNIEISLHEKSINFDPIRAFCFPGDGALWDINTGYAGFGKYYNFCTLEKRKLDYYISLLSTNNENAKEMLGIAGKNITLTISDINGTLYYNYAETLSNDRDIYTIYGTFNNRPVKIKIQISSG
ncbi:MAG: hypothetical protein QXI89_00135 [Candidatus Anstonellales archaeon]